MAIFLVAVLVLGLAVYLALTRPCKSGQHRHRHLRNHHYRSW